MIDLASFSNAMDGLRSLYPSLFRMKAEEKVRRDHAFWTKIQRYDTPIVKRACDLAAERHPDRFPTAGQLIQCCKDALAETRRESVKSNTDGSSDDEDRKIREDTEYLRREIIPDTKEGQVSWCAMARNPLDKLGRYWACESKNSGYDPAKPSPKGVGERRLKEFFELWDAVIAQKKLDPNQKPRVEPKMREPGED